MILCRKMLYSCESFFFFSISLKTAAKTQTPSLSLLCLLDAWEGRNRPWRVCSIPGFWGLPSQADWTPLPTELDSGPQAPPGAVRVTGVVVPYLHLPGFCSSPKDAQPWDTRVKHQKDRGLSDTVEARLPAASQASRPRKRPL